MQKRRGYDFLIIILFCVSDAARLTDEEIGAMYATPMKKEKKAKKSKRFFFIKLYLWNFENYMIKSGFIDPYVCIFKF